MPNRAQLPERDRTARSRLMQLLSASKPIAQASLVSMARTCGRKGCKCAKGDKHVSLYLATRVGKERKMLYVPSELEPFAQSLVENGKRVQQLLEEMSQASIQQLVERKGGQRGSR